MNIAIVVEDETLESAASIHDSRTPQFRKATRELRQTTIIEENQ